MLSRSPGRGPAGPPATFHPRPWPDSLALILTPASATSHATHTTHEGPSSRFPLVGVPSSCLGPDPRSTPWPWLGSRACLKMSQIWPERQSDLAWTVVSKCPKMGPSTPTSPTQPAVGRLPWALLSCRGPRQQHLSERSQEHALFQTKLRLSVTASRQVQRGQLVPLRTNNRGYARVRRVAQREMQRGADIAARCVHILTTEATTLAREVREHPFPLPDAVMPR